MFKWFWTKFSLGAPEEASNINCSTAVFLFDVCRLPNQVSSTIYG